MRATKGDRIIFILVAILLLMGVGYAYLTTNLNINGTANVKSASWNVHFENEVVDWSSTATVEQYPTINLDGNNVTYEVTLNEPGEFFKFDIDVKNDGTIDAMIGAINSTVNGQPISNLPVYLSYSVTYLDGEEVGGNYLLEAGKKQTYTVFIKYRDDITPSQLPSGNNTYVINLNPVIVQATDDAPPKRFNGTVYSNNTQSVAAGGTVEDIGGKSLNPPLYAKLAYLKYIIVDDNISSVHLMVDWGDGTYQEVVPGAENRANNITLFTNHYGASNCSNDQQVFGCEISPEDLNDDLIYITNDGSVGFPGTCFNCMAYSNGSSICHSDVC
jgi:hypothetical protein